MGKHAYKPQSAADAVVEQADRINNLIPLLDAGRSSLAPHADEVEAAKALISHASELRTALSALENMAEAVIFKTEKRKEALLDGFLG
jgi:hypothetical protein